MRKLMICLAGFLSSIAVAQSTPVAAAIFPTSCTYYQCLRDCDDCPYGTINYCISTATCQCGCR